MSATAARTGSQIASLRKQLACACKLSDPCGDPSKAVRRSTRVKLFIVDVHNRIRVENWADIESKKPGRHFSSENEWARIAVRMPMSRLVEIWNTLPRVEPLRRFASREVALS